MVGLIRPGYIVYLKGWLVIAVSSRHWCSHFSCMLTATGDDEGSQSKGYKQL